MFYLGVSGASKVTLNLVGKFIILRIIISIRSCRSSLLLFIYHKYSTKNIVNCTPADVTTTRLQRHISQILQLGSTLWYLSADWPIGACKAWIGNHVRCFLQWSLYKYTVNHVDTRVFCKGFKQNIKKHCKQFALRAAHSRVFWSWHNLNQTSKQMQAQHRFDMSQGLNSLYWGWSSNL